MRYIKPRKPRSIKLNGQRSADLCPCCYSFGCDPFSMSRKFKAKVDYRLDHGLCVACGKPKEFCACKSNHKLKENETRFATHNNKKIRKAYAEIQRKEIIV